MTLNMSLLIWLDWAVKMIEAFPLIDADARIYEALSKSLAPRKHVTVSEWADAHRRLSSKGSAEPGQWRTSRNPILREPMDCFSARSNVNDVVLMFPIQIGKTEVAVNIVGYSMCENPSPIMVALPGEVSMHKWIAQKLNPMLELTTAARKTLTSLDSRNGSNRREFKDFFGGQLYLEHAGSPSRLKSTSVKILLVDELDEFASNLIGGDDPVAMLEGRTSAFPSSYKRLYISTPQIRGQSRIERMYLASDQRRYYVPCPECGEMQPLEWSGLKWMPGGRDVKYMCCSCAVLIDESKKTEMIAAGRWVPKNPDALMRGYHVNGLYYQFGLGVTWTQLVKSWLESQDDPAMLKTFVNDRLAETWEDRAMRNVKHNLIADRAEPYALRTAPADVLVITAGVDTQDDRLAVQIVGWGVGLKSCVLDYTELPGDPAELSVWQSLTTLLETPIAHVSGASLVIDAVAIDAGGHRTEAVKSFVRSARLRRAIAIFGAVPNNAPVLSKPKLQDIDWRGRSDKRGVHIYHVGTVGIKHMLYSRLSSDAEKESEHRLCRFSNQLSQEYFAGLVSETYNVSKNRFEKKRAVRNEPLDTWVYAYAATHHPELRLHRASKADWDRYAARLIAADDSKRLVVKPEQTKRAYAQHDESFASKEWLER